MDQALNSQKTPHTSPLRASYGMSFVSILMKNDRVIKGFYCITLHYWGLYFCKTETRRHPCLPTQPNTETEMSSFWRNFRHWLHWKLSFWQLSVQPVMKISSKWWHFRFSECHYFLHRGVHAHSTLLLKCVIILHTFCAILEAMKTFTKYVTFT